MELKDITICQEVICSEITFDHENRENLKGLIGKVLLIYPQSEKVRIEYPDVNEKGEWMMFSEVFHISELEPFTPAQLAPEPTPLRKAINKLVQITRNKS
jgi:hypothetical protein